MSLIEKAWGWSEAQVLSPMCEIHRIDIKAGGHCSWHQHDKRWNAFSVVTGVLYVEYKPNLVADSEVVRVVMISPGETFAVGPGIIHRFRTNIAVRAFEVYFPEALGQPDIYRFSEGGIAP